MSRQGRAAAWIRRHRNGLSIALTAWEISIVTDARQSSVFTGSTPTGGFVTLSGPPVGVTERIVSGSSGAGCSN